LNVKNFDTERLKRVGHNILFLAIDFQIFY
jgi:hypothetical protein